MTHNTICLMNGCFSLSFVDSMISHSFASRRWATDRCVPKIACHFGLLSDQAEYVWVTRLTAPAVDQPSAPTMVQLKQTIVPWLMEVGRFCCVCVTTGDFVVYFRRLGTWQLISSLCYGTYKGNNGLVVANLWWKGASNNIDCGGVQFKSFWFILAISILIIILPGIYYYYWYKILSIFWGINKCCNFFNENGFCKCILPNR